MQLEQTIQSIIEQSGESAAILVKELDGDVLYSKNADLKIASASLIKIPVMLCVLNDVFCGSRDLDEQIPVFAEDILTDTQVFENGEQRCTLEELIHWMIIESDNTAANVLIKSCGMGKINQYISDILRLKSTRIERYMLDYDAIKKGLNNYTCQNDMLSLFDKLRAKAILNGALCDKALKILANQRCQNHIMRYIYQPVPFAHKTGTLEHLIHDVGIMRINSRDYYIGISVFDSKQSDGNTRLMGNLGKAVYTCLVNS